MLRSWRQPIREAVLSALLFLPHAAVLHGQERITVLIPEQVDSLIIDNRYQQPVSSEERRLLTPYQPMTVVDESGFLGDAFTPCMKVEAEGVLFYLPVDRHRRPLSSRILKRYSDVRSFHDTVEIIPRHSVKFVSIKGQHSLLTNERVRRYFLQEGLTYVRRLAGGEFGWAAIRREEEGKNWSVVVGRNRGLASTDWLATRVRMRISAVNATFRTLFDWFNKDTGQSQDVPQWTVEVKDGRILCALRNDSAASVIRASTLMLGKEFESYVLGTSLQVVVAPGRIEIRNEE